MTLTREPLAPEDVRPALDREAVEHRVRTRGADPADVLTIVGSLAGAMSLVWVLDQRVLPLSGALGFWLLTYLAFLLIYGLTGFAQWRTESVLDKLVSVVLMTAATGVFIVVLDQLVYVIDRGFTAVRHGNFWSQTMSLTGPLSPITSGGIVHALVGSLEQLALSSMFSVPLGILAALYLVEIDDWLARPVRIIVQAMTALPEIIASLFIYILFILTLGQHQCGLAASLALTVMMIPIVTRTSEVVIRLVPGSLREASYALGASQFKTVWKVVLPSARSGLATAVILAMARAVGETSPVLLTAGATNELNWNPFSGPQESLPLYIYTYVRFPQPSMVARAFGAALALMIMVLVLFVLARIIGGKAPGQLTARQRHRIKQDVRAADDLARSDRQQVRADIPLVVAAGYPDPVR